MYSIKVYDEYFKLIKEHHQDHNKDNVTRLAEDYARKMKTTINNDSSDCMYIFTFTNGKALGFSI